MRAAVVYYGEKQTRALKELSEGLAAGLENQGARVDIINAREFSGRLAIYQFIAIGTENTGTFGGKIPQQMKEFLNRAEARIGTRAYAFMPARGLRAEKGLLALMTALENQGLFLVISDLLSNRQAAQDAGSGLPLKQV